MLERERLVWLAVVTLCVFALYRCDVAARERYGMLGERLRLVDSAHRVLTAHDDSLATRLAAQRPVAATTAIRWRTLIDSFRDTLWDTVPFTPRESTIVEAADTAIRACTEALGTCAALVRSKDALILNREAALTLERSRRPSFFAKLRRDVVMIGAGYLLHTVTK